jgi:hypothetical protein
MQSPDRWRYGKALFVLRFVVYGDREIFPSQGVATAFGMQAMSLPAKVCEEKHCWPQAEAATEGRRRMDRHRRRDRAISAKGNGMKYECTLVDGTGLRINLGFYDAIGVGEAAEKAKAKHANTFQRMRGYGARIEVQAQPDFKNPLARNADPHTSKTAAKMAVEPASKWRSACLAAIRSAGPMTGHEVAAYLGTTYDKVHKRLPELKEAGFLEWKQIDPAKLSAAGWLNPDKPVYATRLSPAGRPCVVWYLSPKR